MKFLIRTRRCSKKQLKRKINKIKTPDKINTQKLVKRYNKHDERCPFCKETDTKMNRTIWTKPIRDGRYAERLECDNCGTVYEVYADVIFTDVSIIDFDTDKYKYAVE